MPERPVREEIDDLIVRTREAHEVLKDIRSATRELKEVIRLAEETRQGVAVMIAAVTHDAISDAVDAGLENWTRAIDEAIVDATNAVYQRFDVIAAILLGEAGDMEDAARLVRGTLEKGHVMTPHEQWQMDEMQKALDRRIGEQLPEVKRQSLAPDQAARPNK